MDKKQLMINIAADLDLVARDAPADRILQLVIHARIAPREARRHPLNLGLVLDRSGSMQGEKLGFVKQAAAHILDLLDEQDRVALIVYDNRVEVLSPSCQVTPDNRVRMQFLINSVNAGSTTFLSGGWLRGCEEVAEAAQANSLNHTLLLTDGLANVGITDPEILAQHARELARRDVTTSTFGVGGDYNHLLLEAVANQGGGSYYFIETPNDIPGIFNREFEELAHVAAKDVEIVIEMPPEFKADVLGDWRVEPAGNLMRINLGNLRSHQEQRVYLESHFPPAGDRAEMMIKALVRGKAESGEVIEAETTLVFRSASKEEMDTAVRNQDVLEGHAQVKLAQKTKEALIMEREGKRKEAFELMNQSIQASAPVMPPNAVDEYRRMSERMLAGMDEMDRKQSHYRRYLDSKQREEWREYPLVQHDQHLLIDADGRKVLIDTGSPVSTGREAEWYFLGHRYNPPPDFKGMNLDTVSVQVGERVDVLLGIDILKNLYFRVDFHRAGVIFSTYPLALGGSRLQILVNKSTPIIRCIAGNTGIGVVFATRTKLTLLASNLVNGYSPIDKKMVRYLGAEEFETPVYEIPFELAGKHLSLRCGVLPANLERYVIQKGAMGILGTELFDHFSIEVAFPQEAIFFNRKR
jgi:Ca-activated chloride channel family protein